MCIRDSYNLVVTGPLGMPTEQSTINGALKQLIEENLALAYLRAGTAPHAISSRISRKDKELFREKLALLNMGLEDRMKQPVGCLLYTSHTPSRTPSLST